MNSKETPKVWYHGTTKNCWKKIQSEGILIGRHDDGNYSYLALEKEEADCYGEVTLRIEYNPILDLFNNNYTPYARDIRVSTPIKLANIQTV